MVQKLTLIYVVVQFLMEESRRRQDTWNRWRKRGRSVTLLNVVDVHTKRGIHKPYSYAFCGYKLLHHHMRFHIPMHAKNMPFLVYINVYMPPKELPIFNDYSLTSPLYPPFTWLSPIFLTCIFFWSHACNDNHVYFYYSLLSMNDFESNLLFNEYEFLLQLTWTLEKRFLSA